MLYFNGGETFMEELDLKKLQHVADLSKIEIKDDEELRNLSTKIKSIIAHSERLNDLDLSDVEPMTHAMQIENTLREDKAGKPVTQEEALRNTEFTEEGQFKVPRMI